MFTVASLGVHGTRGSLGWQGTLTGPRSNRTIPHFSCLLLIHHHLHYDSYDLGKRCFGRSFGWIHRILDVLLLLLLSDLIGEFALAFASSHLLVCRILR